ncbi:MAG TPA: hypothetical protein VEQ66_14215 [Propionibacteriaceae bacterium]|nr:hypothetical protein [Propionibacteriaceae bacterium]
MSRLLLPPVVVVVVAAVAVGIAFVLDQGGVGQRDAALLIGTVGLWVLAAGTLWLIAALVSLAGKRRRLPRS